MKHICRIALLVTCFVSSLGCVFVEPKSSVKIDTSCNSAYEYYRIGLDDTPGQGLVVLEQNNEITIGPNIPATVGSCANEECLDVIASLAKQFFVETVAAGTYVLAKNIAAEAANHSRCAQTPTPVPVIKVVEEDLNQYL